MPPQQEQPPQGGGFSPAGNIMPQQVPMAPAGSNPLMQQLQGQPPQAPGQQPPLRPLPPEALAKIHDRFSDMQKTMNRLLKLPNDDLTLPLVYGEMSDQITKNRLSRGKEGASAMQIVQELNSPDFPKEDAQGHPPSPKDIRAYLQKKFDMAAATQAVVTQKLGPPPPPLGAPGAAIQSSPMQNNQLMNSASTLT